MGRNIMINKTPILSGPEFGPTSGLKPKQLIILCHGLGADGNDLIGLAPHYAQFLPDAKFISPNAPYNCDMSPYGYQWFSLQERSEEAMLEGVRKAQPILDAFIDEQLVKYNLKEKQVALIGFSQGTMVSMFTVPRRNSAVAGVVGYSGRLIGGNLLPKQICCRPPMAMINGDLDDLVPVTVQAPAVEALRSVGIKIEGHIRPGLGHSIDNIGIKIGQEFLSKIF